MARSKGNRPPKVEVRFYPASDSEERLRHAYSLILSRAAARAELSSASGGSPVEQAGEDASPGREAEG